MRQIGRLWCVWRSPEFTQECSPKRSDVCPYRKGKGVRISDAWNFRVNVDMNETVSRYHGRIPERFGLAQSGSQNQDSPRRILAHVGLDRVVAAHSSHTDEQ